MVAVAAGIQEFEDDLGILADRFVGPSQWEPEARYTPDFGPTGGQVIASLQFDGTLFGPDEFGNSIFHFRMSFQHDVLVVDDCLLKAQFLNADVVD